MDDRWICRIKYKFQILASSLSLFAVVVLGCSGILPCDDQVSLPSHIQKVVNPQPVKRNFIQNNRSHKILVAVIDTGVDYNHPALLDNIRFSLDVNHKPIRFGWDFTGQDAWPSPYIGRRTAISDFELNLIDKLIEEDNQLGIYLDKRRNVVQEHLASVWHGTSLAKLVVREEKQIGLLAYRVVPPNTVHQAVENYSDQIIHNISDACRLAVDDSANIIVMTSFLHFEKKENPSGYVKIKNLKDKLEKFIRCHPGVLFIASAGNGYGYRYSGRNLEQIDFPAGIIAENLLVVGSLSENREISSFSNIPTDEIKAVFYPGRNSTCIYPQNMLGIPEEYLTMLPSLLDNLIDGNESYNSVASYLRMFMKNNAIVHDGTSFSTALAANVCAQFWVEDIELTPAKIIEKLFEITSTNSQVSFNEN